MILHRLKLTNFRGVAERELTFPEQGVVVVCGPNEIGKSSMLEALDLLLEYKDRSAHQRVKQVKPTHADVGAEVEAEVSTGPYRFVYRKRFHKKHRTELEVLQPRREQHTGDEAHERVRAILEETVDTRLWEAQRVLQSAATEAVDLSGCDALTRALDAAAGDAAGPGGTESLLIDRVDAEYGRYFTPAAGKPSKEYKDVLDRLRAAEDEAQRCRALLADVEDRVTRHETLSTTRAELTGVLGPATDRRTAAVAAAAALAQLREQLEQAQLVAAAALGTSSASQAAQLQRAKLVEDSDRRSAALRDLQQALIVAAEEEDAARLAAQSAEAASAEAAARALAAQQRAEAARAAAQACSDRDDADRLADRISRIDDTQAALGRADAELAAIALSADVLAEIEQADALARRLAAHLDADTGTVAFTAVTDLSLVVDGEPLTLNAGQDWSSSASTPVTLELPGLLRVRIDPGVTAADLRAKLLAAQKVRDELLTQGGVADVASARETDRRRRELAAARDQLAATLAGLTLGEDPAQLRERLTQLRANALQAGADPESAAAELRTATADVTTAGVAADTAHAAATSAATDLAVAVTATTVLRDRVQTAETELAAVCDQLAQSRAHSSDEQVAATATADAAKAEAAATALGALRERYEDANPAAVDAELTAARDAVETIGAELAEVQRQLAALSAQLEVIGGEGRRGLLDAAEAELEQARHEHARIEQRATAARLLRDTMVRHRDNTRQRYVAPFRAELERLGRIVFGEDFGVEVDIDLTIRGRSLRGRTVPYDSLSGGAKEQLGILARLAGAALVAEEDTVPVVIDDALGFSDSDRLTRMGEVFTNVGGRGQVIVLTCQRDRYAGITDATVVELSA